MTIWLNRFWAPYAVPASCTNTPIGHVGAKCPGKQDTFNILEILNPWTLNLPKQSSNRFHIFSPNLQACLSEKSWTEIRQSEVLGDASDPEYGEIVAGSISEELPPGNPHLAYEDPWHIYGEGPLSYSRTAVAHHLDFKLQIKPANPIKAEDIPAQVFENIEPTGTIIYAGKNNNEQIRIPSKTNAHGEPVYVYQSKDPKVTLAWHPSEGVFVATRQNNAAIKLVTYEYSGEIKEKLKLTPFKIEKSPQAIDKNILSPIVRQIFDEGELMRAQGFSDLETLTSIAKNLQKSWKYRYPHEIPEIARGFDEDRINIIGKIPSDQMPYVYCDIASKIFWIAAQAYGYSNIYLVSGYMGAERGQKDGKDYSLLKMPHSFLEYQDPKTGQISVLEATPSLASNIPPKYNLIEFFDDKLHFWQHTLSDLSELEIYRNNYNIPPHLQTIPVEKLEGHHNREHLSIRINQAFTPLPFSGPHIKIVGFIPHAERYSDKIKFYFNQVSGQYYMSVDVASLPLDIDIVLGSSQELKQVPSWGDPDPHLTATLPTEIKNILEIAKQASDQKIHGIFALNSIEIGAFVFTKLKEHKILANNWVKVYLFKNNLGFVREFFNTDELAVFLLLKSYGYPSTLSYDLKTQSSVTNPNKGCNFPDLYEHELDKIQAQTRLSLEEKKLLTELIEVPQDISPDQIMPDLLRVTKLMPRFSNIIRDHNQVWVNLVTLPERFLPPLESNIVRGITTQSDGTYFQLDFNKPKIPILDFYPDLQKQQKVFVQRFTSATGQLIDPKDLIGVPFDVALIRNTTMADNNEKTPHERQPDHRVRYNPDYQVSFDIPWSRTDAGWIKMDDTNEHLVRYPLRNLFFYDEQEEIFYQLRWAFRDQNKPDYLIKIPLHWGPKNPSELKSVARIEGQPAYIIENPFSITTIYSHPDGVMLCIDKFYSIMKGLDAKSPEQIEILKILYGLILTHLNASTMASGNLEALFYVLSQAEKQGWHYISPKNINRAKIDINNIKLCRVEKKDGDFVFFQDELCAPPSGKPGSNTKINPQHTRLLHWLYEHVQILKNQDPSVEEYLRDTLNKF